MPKFAYHAREDAIGHEFCVASIEGSSGQSGIEVDASPFVFERQFRVIDVENLETFNQRPIVIGQDGLPLRTPAAKKHLFIDTFDQSFFARKVAIQQPLRDAEFSGQFARLPAEPVLCEKSDRPAQYMFGALAGGRAACPFSASATAIEARTFSRFLLWGA